MVLLFLVVGRVEGRAEEIAGVWVTSLIAVLGVVGGLKCSGCSMAAIAS